MGTVRVTASANEAANYKFIFSRDQMIKAGIPEDYTAALVDDGCMETLIKVTEHQADTRKLKLDRHVMNQAVVVFLCLQAMLGIWLAFYGARREAFV
mmetsp:Transcript_101761/g.273352  ORF Transcript_101761/g.273352 Transcript_101761/m.273352 type:complete len:97 (-) Transcript_101761:225-515(-)